MLRNVKCDEKYILFREIYFEPGNAYSYVIISKDIDDIDHVILEWRYIMASYNPLAWRIMKPPSVIVDSLYIQSLTKRYKWQTCFY